jgi:predicted Zn-dependent protease
MGKIVRLWAVILCLLPALPAGAEDPGAEAAEALAAMERALGESGNWTSPEDVYYLGRAAAAQILALYPPYTENPRLTGYLNRICLSLAVNSPRPWPYNGYQVGILDKAEIMAFATPGGHIFISRGLLRRASSEDALAALIAHEMAHIQLNHGVEFLEEARFAGELRALGAASAARAYRALSPEDRLESFAASVTALVDELIRNGYSQTQEFQADRYALSLLAAAGYDPAAMPDILRVLAPDNGHSWYTTTHPSPAGRLANLAGELGKYRLQDTRSYRLGRFRAAMAEEF